MRQQTAEEIARRRPLSPAQARVLTALCLFTARRRKQPSMADLAAQSGVSVGTIAKHLAVIEARGWIGGSAGKPRAIEIPADVFDSIVETGELPQTLATTEE